MTAQQDPDRLHDVIVVGGGLAGLTAAYRLRHRDVVVVERAAQVGGRLLSYDRSGIAMNLGAHMFSGLGTGVGDLLTELGLQRQPIQGQLMGIVMGGGTVLRGRPEFWPMRLPLSPRARFSFVNMGLRLRFGAQRMARAMASSDGGLGHEDHRTLAEFMGPLHPEVSMILAAITERSGGDPSIMSAGHALRSFTNVWSGQAPGANLAGGSSQLILALAKAIGAPRIFTGASVLTVEQTLDQVDVTIRTDNKTKRLRARHCIMATPASVARRIAAGLPPDTADALGQIGYGAFLSVAVLTKERGVMPWQGVYGIATPGAPFSVVFNQATFLPHSDPAKRGSLMLFRGGAPAAVMACHDDAKLAAMARGYLHEIFRGADFGIEDIIVSRWPHGAPVARPGRAGLQRALEKNLGRISLAGDYLESPNMNSAIWAANRAVANLTPSFQS
jgi:oxygen-dependent protoporphyrinogen oxidase